METEREAVFGLLRAYPDELLNQQPRPGAWSIVEIIAHLLTAEEMSLKYLRKKVQDTSLARKEGFGNWWKWLVMRFVFTFNIKFKAPEIVEPKMGYQKLADLELKWKTIRTETRQELERLSDDECDHELWKHAIAGRMNLHHMLQFFHIHCTRHYAQIQRTLQALS